jgi:two-component system sensor histidine kinase/response regulator
MDINNKIEQEKEKQGTDYDELKSVNIRLEKQVQARTLELESAVQSATKANHAKSFFLANMSHEIRTPINAMMGLTHLMMQTDITPKQKDYLNKIKISGNALQQIINDILDFSKIEAERLELEKTEFNIEELLNNAATVIGYDAQVKGIEFNFDLDLNIPTTLVGDPFRLGQIFGNLCSNALKFTERGQILIAVTIVDKSKEKITLRFSVKDTGIGMSATEIQKLYQPFSQADVSTTRKFGGTGLGLSITKRLVELMDGKLEVASEEGHGSEFIFTVAFPTGTPVLKKPIPMSMNFKGIRVLVVDDNIHVRKVLRKMLEKMTFAVSTANSGQAAISKAEIADNEGATYGLIFTDYKMPGMNGVETVRRIKKKIKNSRYPKAVLVSGFRMDKIHDDEGNGGVDGYLAKPITQSNLMEVIIDIYKNDTLDEAVPLQKEMQIPSEKACGLKGVKILLVEDNAINRQVASEILENEGVVVVTATTGKEALKLVRHDDFDAVLMDIQMPEMDGFAATREIRKMEDRRQVFEDSLRADHGPPPTAIRPMPIIAMTAHAMAGDIEKCRAAGMNAHVAKPLDLHKLFGVLLKWVKPGGDKNHCQDETDTENGTHIALPASLPGIDLNRGLARLENNRALFMKLLVLFSNDHRDTVQAIGSAITSNDSETAIRLSHTLRGLAGTIGAGRLTDAAEALENAIRAEIEELGEYLDRTTVALEQVLASIALLGQDGG